MQDKKKKIHAKKMRYAGLLSAVLLLFCGCTKKEELLLLSEETAFPDEETSRMEEMTAVESADKDLEPQEPAVENPGVIYIHVCGAVLQPGVYELKEGSRVYEAVQAAGGFAEGADQNYVNQAQELSDGIKLVIPTMEEAREARERESPVGLVQENTANAGSEAQAEDSDGRININTASEAQLCDIPGVGATRAAAIAAYRESHGGFQKPEDIMKVNGIKEGMYEKIKDSISVN